MRNFFVGLFLLLLFGHATAQQPWTANLSFNPRPTPFIDQWQTNGTIGTLTVFSAVNSPTQIIIAFQVTNLSTNKIVLRGRTSPQNINAYPSPTILSNTNFIGSTNLQYDESQKAAMLRTGMLPEGQYSICLTLLSLSNQTLAQNICANFGVASVDAPTLLTPNDLAKLQSAPTLFSWTPVQNLTGSSVYEIVVSEVYGKQSLADAIGMNPPVVHERGLTAASYLLTPELASRLKSNVAYAWRVRVLDGSGKSFARRDGYSEVSHFIISGAESPLVKTETRTGTVKAQTTIKGVMQYAFADPFGKEGLSLYPLKATGLRLVVRRYTQSGNKKKFYGDDSLIATTSTDASGNFSFKTFYSDSTGVVGIGGKGKQNRNSGIGQQLFRAAFVIIDDIHYTSPDNEIVLESGKLIDAGTIHGLARSFGLDVTVKDIKPPYVVGGATVYLLRVKKGAHVPDEEGSPRPDPPQVFFGVPIIGKAVTDAYGRVSFGRMVECYYDEQYLIAVDPPLGLGGYHYPAAMYPVQQSGASMSAILALSPIMNSEYSWKEYAMDIAPDKITSVVKGKLNRGFPGSKSDNTPLSGTNVRLQIRYKNPSILPGDFAPESYPDNGKVVAFAKTDAKGDFVFSFTDVPTTSNTEGVTRMYRIIVDDKHFTSPDDDVTLQPGDIKNIGSVIANIRSYNLTVHTMKSKGGDPVTGMYVYVRRPMRPASVPDDEGTPHPDPPMTRSDEEVVAVGLTAGDDASGTLSRLVRCYSDNERYHLEIVADPTTGKNYLGFGWDDFSDQNDVAEFNSQYIIPTFDQTIKVLALPPAITGRVLREDNPMTPVPKALVTMSVTFSGDPDWNPSGAATTTDKDGYYFIDGNQANGAYRVLQATKHGYHDSKIVNLPQSINSGEQAYNELTLMPVGVVKGKVFHAWSTPSDGNTGYRAAWVTVEGGSSVYTASDFAISTDLDEPSTVVIEPDDHSYFSDTAVAYKPHSSELDLGNRYLMKKLHRMKIRTLDEETNTPISFGIVATEMASPLFPGSVIPPLNQNGDTSFWEPFESSDQYFSFTTYTNTDADYEHRTFAIKNPVSRDFIPYDLKTRKAGFISGTVYLFSKKSGKKDAIDYAKIRLEQGSANTDGLPVWTPKFPGSSGQSGSQQNGAPKYTMDELSCYSGYSLEHIAGRYKLGNIPIGKHTFMASKTKSGTIGDEKIIDVPKQGVTNVDFFLQVYEDMDITQMLGIPMDVEKLDSTVNGVYITGSLSELPSSPHFKADPSVELPFTTIKIIPGATIGANGVPYPKPALLPMYSDISTLSLSYAYAPSGTYNIQLRSNQGTLTLDAPPSGKGFLSGKIYVPANQFSPKVSFTAGVENGFYLRGLTSNGAETGVFPILTQDGTDAFTANPNGLHIIDVKGGDGKYLLLGYNAQYESGTSLLRGDSITLTTSVNLPKLTGGNQILQLPIGQVRLRKIDLAFISPAGSAFPDVPLDAWTLQGKKISFSGDNLSLDGVIKTGTVDVPFSGMPITPQGWKPDQATFNLTSLSIDGFIPLELSGTVGFGHDIAATPPCWKLYSTGKPGAIVASFGGIKSAPPGDSIYVTSFALTSLGSNSFLVKQSVPLHLYNYLIFTPTTLTVDGSTVTIQGNDRLNVAEGFNFSNRTLALTNQGGVLGFDVKKLLYDISNYYAKGTRSNFPLSGQDLNESGFSAIGTLVDDPYPKSYSFPVKLTCSQDSTAITVLPVGAQNVATTFPITKDGSKNLSSIRGGLLYDYDSHSWSNLRFSGLLTGASGASSTLSLKVSGAIQTDGDQKMSVTNIPTPFGSCAMTYDFASGAMHGAIDLDADLPGAGHIDGQADLEIDHDGWYFAAAGDLQIYNPNIGIQVGLVIGSYPNILSISDITGKFGNLPWKPEVPAAMRSIPQAYNSLSGFYFAGEATNFLGISLPSIDVDLDPIVHCSASAYYGAALSLGMNFSNGKQFDIGAAVFLGVDADAGGSIGIACGGGSLHVGLNLYGVGAFNTSNGNWSLSGGSDLVLSGELYAGWGVCSSSCGWFSCDKHTWGPASMSFGLIGFHVSPSGISISP